MKLYECQIEITSYVVAENEDEAKKLAQESLREEIYNVSRYEIDIIEEPAYLYGGYDNCYPYGEDDGKTVKEWHDDILAAIKKKKDHEKYLANQHNLFDT